MSIEKTSGQPSRLAAPDIAFKKELEALRDQRRIPDFTRELTPGGSVVQVVHSREERRREVRISVIDHRLREIRGRVETDFKFAELEGRARFDFERSR